jgi:hypothetical protein
MNSSTALDLHRLRTELEARFGNAFLPARPEPRPGLLTGNAALDSLLPGGVPRGGLSLWTGTGTSGRTATLRSLVRQTAAAGARPVIVDATATLSAADWCSTEGAREGIWVARPPQGGRAEEGGWAAEALLRAGVFDLVILDGVFLEAAHAHRLRAMARERGAALVVSTESPPSGWRADLRLDFRAVEHATGLRTGGRYRRGVQVTAAKGGSGGTTREFEIIHTPVDVLGPGESAPDRRSPPA